MSNTRYEPPPFVEIDDTLPLEYHGAEVRCIERGPAPGWMKIEFINIYSRMTKRPLKSYVPEFHLIGVDHNR